MKSVNEPVAAIGRANQFDGCSVYLLSLGCAKNLVDSECMSKILIDAGCKIIDSPSEADILVVNTCGFIESAKQEAIAAILDLADYKQPSGLARGLVVTGCLAQRYAKEILRDLPEVDIVLGTGEYADIADAVKDLFIGGRPAVPRLPGYAGSLEHLTVTREPSTPGRYAFVKVAEGCSNCCTYCAIPGIRGAFHSRPLADIVSEAARLSLAGRDEIILIAQDTTRYGLDIAGERLLVPLLREICSLETVRLVRILYVYADGLTDELIQFMASEPKIAHYLDLPIQHAADRILMAMNRRDSKESLRNVIARLRTAMPDMILRTTVMVGFPGETDEDFAELLDFLADIRFERLGCFIFSPEEGTPAWQIKPRVTKSVASRRNKIVMQQQRQITDDANRRRIGQVIDVTLESVDDNGIFFIGRSYGEAPDIDPVIYVAATTENLALGQTCPVRLVEAGDYDMTGVTQF